MKIMNLKNKVKTCGELKEWLQSSAASDINLDKFETMAFDWLFVNCNENDSLNKITIPFIEYTNNGSSQIMTDSDYDWNSTFLTFWEALEAEHWFREKNLTAKQ